MEEKSFTITMTEKQLGTLGGLLDMAAKAGGLRVSKDVVGILAILEAAAPAVPVVQQEEVKPNDEAGND